jgi:hypothetical protein
MGKRSGGKKPGMRWQIPGILQSKRTYPMKMAAFLREEEGKVKIEVL